MKYIVALTSLLAFNEVYASDRIDMASNDADRVASVACAVMAETLKIDSAQRVREVNNARYEIGAEPYLLGDDLIIEAIKVGTCKLLVEGNSSWRVAHNSAVSKYYAAKSAAQNTLIRCGRGTAVFVALKCPEDSFQISE